MNNSMWVCPNCGSELKSSAKFCRSCGADEKHGWNDDLEDSFGIELPTEEDYDDMVAKEFGSSKSNMSTKDLIKKGIVATVALILGIAMLVASI